MRPLVTVLCASLLLAAGAASAADTATLTVKVDGVGSAGGSVIVAVYDFKTFPVRGSKPLAKMTAPAKPGETVVTFLDLPPGTYGLKAMQDENGDGHMHFMLGLPTEPYGFSNDPDPGLSVPAFDVAKIVVKPGANSATITLHAI